MKAFAKLSLALVFFSLLFHGCSQKEKETPVAKTFSERMDSLFTTVPDFSGVALVADKGKPVYHNALKWDRSLYTESLVKKTTLEEAFTPRS